MYDFKSPYLGSAYYPESWPREQIAEDLDTMLAHGLNTVRIAEFAWSTLEPEEGHYDLSLFREVVDQCRARGISVILCTPSATPPAWMETGYPDIMMQIDHDRATHGARRMSCPSSPRFRDFCRKIVHVLGREFGRDENIIGWQIDNELSTMPKEKGCTCPSCVQAFRTYLKQRYGTIEALNRAWKHNTWSLQFQSFDQIDPPNSIAGMPPSHKLAWAEYKSAIYADFCAEQAAILRQYTDAPIGTDMMPTQQLDFELTNAPLDVVQFNHYSGPHYAARYFDFLRTLKERPFWVTETATCWNGSTLPCGPRRRDFCVANSLLPFAMGGEANLYWLYRDHLGGHEQMHGSVVDSWGRERQMADEVRYVSAALDKLRPMLNGTHVAQRDMAITWTHTTFYIARYNGMQYDADDNMHRQVHAWLSDAHYRPDVIGAGADLSRYKLIISPQQYTLEEKGFVDRILEWVRAGGTWIAGPLTDVQTQDANKYANAPYGHLEDWAQIRRAFYIPAPRPGHWYSHEMPAGVPCHLQMQDGSTAALVSSLYDALVPGDGVRVRATYDGGLDGYLEGYAAITETPVGRGRIIVLGALPEGADYVRFIQTVAAECGIHPITEGSSSVLNSLLAGEYGEVFTAIESRGVEDAWTVIPFAGQDILTGQNFTAGQRVSLRPYTCLFIHRT